MLTEKGVDDILALLLAFSAAEEELEVLLISVTYGNIPLADCLCNTILILSRVRDEIQWRQNQRYDPGFEALRASRPILATGPGASLLDEERLDSIFERASQIWRDDKFPSGCTSRTSTGGLSDAGASNLEGRQINDTVQHACRQYRQSGQSSMFEEIERRDAVNNEHEMRAVKDELRNPNALFNVTQTPAHEEILRLLCEHEQDTITIIALGPLTNIALAMAKDATTFSRAKEFVIMGGNLAATNTTAFTHFDKRHNLKPSMKVNSISTPAQTPSV